MGGAKSKTNGEWESSLTIIWDSLVKRKVECNFTREQFTQHQIYPDQERLQVIKEFASDVTCLPDWFEHRFVVFKTTNCWWSIEKNNKGLFLQKSVSQNGVVDWCWGKKRKDIEIVQGRSNQGKGTLYELILYIRDKDLIYERYNFLTRNCQHFAKEIFNKFGAVER